MANVPSVLSKIQTEQVTSGLPTGEGVFASMAANINGLIDALGLDVYEFTGSTSWVAPAGASRAVLIGCGGGGGGGGGGGTGGTAAALRIAAVTLAPGVTYDVAIGAGGSAAVSANGGTGGATTFKQGATTLASFAGGRGGGNSGSSNGNGRGEPGPFGRGGLFTGGTGEAAATNSGGGGGGGAFASAGGIGGTGRLILIY